MIKNKETICMQILKSSLACGECLRLDKDALYIFCRRCKYSGWGLSNVSNYIGNKSRFEIEKLVKSKEIEKHVDY